MRLGTPTTRRLPRLLRPPLTHEAFLATAHFSAFDGVRAIAATMVVLFHYGGHRTEWLNGWLGVQLFFVLSGFLITTLLLREEAVDGRISLRNFWVRRIARIVPVYYLILVLTFAWILATGSWVRERAGITLPYYLAFLPEWSPASSEFGHSWTIGIEQKFYLVWPLLSFVLLPLLTRRAAVRLVLLGIITLVCLGLPQYGLVQYSVLALGCALAVAMNSRGVFPLVAWLAAPVPRLVALAALVTVQLSSTWLSALWGFQEPVVFLYGLAVTMVIPGLIAPGRVSRALSIRPLRWVGERSYSLYLVQVLAGIAVAATFAMPGFGLLRAALVWVVSALAADVIFRYVERPAIRFGKRFVRRPSLGRPVLPRPLRDTDTPAPS